MSVLKASLIHHIGLVLVLLWLLSSFNCCHPVAYVISFVYLHQVHERYTLRLQKKLQFQERRQANKKRILSDSETARWLNDAVEKMWPICLEHVVSNKILLPIIPWFLDKYKPWTAKKATIQHLYLGRNPPTFTDMRILRRSSDDDHLVLELGMNFLTADDMGGILSVKLRKRLGFGMWTKLHLTGMHVEGKVLVGVKFLRHWPFIGRLRVCFLELPYFQLTVKPISTHALDVTEIPGIAGWLDKLLGLAFERTLVEPNMLVVDVEKFASPDSGCWFSMDEKEPVAYARVEVIEAVDMKPSDLNGLADPYVKGQLGPYIFKTKTQWKTLSPKWQEEFKIPICSWELLNMLVIKVQDKDRFVDDALGECSVNITDLKDGQRHDMWLCLENIKMGRLHLAITVLKDQIKEPSGVEISSNNSSSSSSPEGDSCSGRIADVLEPVDIVGKDEVGVWVHQPGSEVPQTWKPRKGARVLDNEISSQITNMSYQPDPAKHGSFPNAGCSSSDEDPEKKQTHRMRTVRRGLHKISSMLHPSSKNEHHLQNPHDIPPSPNASIKEVKVKDVMVKLVVEEGSPNAEGRNSTGGSGSDSPPVKMKDMAKNMLKHARNFKHVLSKKGLQSHSEQGKTMEMPTESSSSSEESHSSSDTSARSEGKPADALKAAENHLPNVDPGNVDSPSQVPLLGTYEHSG